MPRKSPTELAQEKLRAQLERIDQQLERLNAKHEQSRAPLVKQREAIQGALDKLND